MNIDERVAVLREMRWWDIEPVMALEFELFGDEAWSPTMFWSELAEHATRHYLVATSHDRIVAYAGLCAYPPHESYVQTIAVAPSAQGHGLGTQLLTVLIDESLRRGCRRLDLEVRADNDVAVRLYERHGFVRVGLRRSYYQPSGADALVMRRVAS
jgi:[ribosomal protein S18]-alanine N-acetyltransferase